MDAVTDEWLDDDELMGLYMRPAAVEIAKKIETDTMANFDRFNEWFDDDDETA
jgi:hypothetical protein